MDDTSTPSDHKYITLTINGIDLNLKVREFYFPVKFDSPLGNLKKRYASASGTNVSANNFFYRGRRIADQDTLKSIGMDNFHTIEAVQVKKTIMLTETTDAGKGFSMKPGHVKMKIVDSDLAEVPFRIGVDSTMGYLMEIYAEGIEVECASVRFMFNAREVHDSDTPKSLGMVDDDIIDVFQQ